MTILIYKLIIIRSAWTLFFFFLVFSCTSQEHHSENNQITGHAGQLGEDNPPVASRFALVTATDGLYISWKEHLIDGPGVGEVALSGSDGLIAGDLDMDGYPDIISVHEGDTVYDGIPRGYIRIAFGSNDPDVWELVTLAEGSEAGAAEDVAIGDMNGDGWPDILAACELSHLIYFQNPGKDIRSSRWERMIPPITLDRGSFIRVFCADFNADGKLEVTAANKGAQDVNRNTNSLNPISWFEISGEPLDGSNWIEHELTQVVIPENSRPVDLDGDGDLDIVGASRNEDRIMWFENLGTAAITFKEHPIEVVYSGKPMPVSGVNMDFEDLNRDGKLDIVLFESPERSRFGWIKQPISPEGEWEYHRIGSVNPDRIIGLVLADINGDGNPDVMTGTYSSSTRNRDGDQTVNDALGRLAWFEHPEDPKGPWNRHDISRRVRGMFDKFVPMDLDKDGDMDFLTTRGNSYPYDGVLWMEQIRTQEPQASFTPARTSESKEVGLPTLK